MPQISLLTITDPVNAGASSAYVNANGLQDVEMLVESTLNRACDFYVYGASDAAGTGAQDIGNGKKLTLPAGNSTTQKGILSFSAWPGFVKVFADPSGGDATGDATIRILAVPRRG